MRMIISHVNTDFDALASMFAAKKLYPDAHIVITDKQNIPVRQFLNIYRETLPLIQDHEVDWEAVTEIILVDVASLSRAGDYVRKMDEKKIKITVYDHHPPHENDVQKDAGIIEPVGAAVTLLLEEIQQQKIEINPLEATLFGLGIYTDTGSFTYTNTTARDFRAASYLMEQGMNVEMIHRFSEETLLPEQQEILNHLFQQSTTHHVEGLEIVVCSYEQDTFQKGLATFTQKLLEITDADAVIAVVGMKKRVYVVGRASSERINLLPLLQKWKGGGHPQAGSATIKGGEQHVILDEVLAGLSSMIQPAITARDMMASPVKTIEPETSIEEAGKLMYRYGHSGFPVVKEEQLLGMITRRDLEKANHHGLGHAPVKAYMTTNVVSIPPETTEEEIQRMIIEKDIGRLPVVEHEKLIGIVSRTNVIQVLHDHVKNQLQEKRASMNHLQSRMKQQLPTEIYTLLTNIRDVAQRENVSAYLIGGIVRDIMLGRTNDDIDIVIEGDGVDFAKQLTSTYGGDVVVHESFGTATWTTTSGMEIDVTTSRLEFYERPAALPDVETSTLQEDLYRRDFTINAMALSLHPDSFGELIDPFRGQKDLQEKQITILHNLSFVEDPTRILRGVRFETRFGFTMDTQTENLALESMERMKDVSKHRIIEEMKRIFSEPHPSCSMKRLYALQFWQQFGIHASTKEEISKHLKTLHELHEQEEMNDWFSYFVIPFFHEGNLEAAHSFALIKRHAKYVHELVHIRQLHDLEEKQSLGELHRTYKDFSTQALLFFAALGKKGSSQILQYVHRRHDLPNYLSGQDLLAHGLTPSALFSEILLDVDVAILNGEITSTKEAEHWLEERLRTE